MRHLKRMTLLALICLVALAGTVQAESNDRDDHDDDRVSLELTQAQTQQVLKSRTRHMEIMVGLEADLQRLIIKEKEIMDSPELDLKRLRTVVADQGDVMVKMSMVEIDALEDLKTILGPDTWKAFVGLLDEAEECEDYFEDHPGMAELSREESHFFSRMDFDSIHMGGPELDMELFYHHLLK
ncbi:MAG: hypothetical protein MI747_20965 [Desulfobacterales bacterium]|nr:hypothetical protein [Desulfobacterales bacterium]